MLDSRFQVDDVAQKKNNCSKRKAAVKSLTQGWAFHYSHRNIRMTTEDEKNLDVFQFSPVFLLFIWFHNNALLSASTSWTKLYSVVN